MAYLTSAYSTVVYLTTDFGQGTGVIVGKHTILTASHVVWSADQNRTTGAFALSFGTSSATPALKLSASDGGATLHYNKVNDAGGVISIFQSQYDYAVINVSADLSAYGAMNLSAGFTSGSVHVTGYPYTAQGAQTDNLAVARSSQYLEILTFVDSDVTHGNSGGPVWTLVGGVATVVGIVSAGSAASETAARISVASYADIAGWIAEANLRYSQPVAAPTIGRPSANTGFSNYFGKAGADAITASAGNDFIFGGSGDDAIDGRAGFDLMIYETGRRADFQVSVGAVGVTVVKTTLGGRDVLTNVERIQFADGVLAFDAVGDLGQAYRLYQAAFNRTPDESGLSFWVRRLDAGVSLNAVAEAFIASGEFQATYGANPAPRQIVEALYSNILGRAGETAGVDYWTAALQSGATAAQALVGFSESQENVANLAGVLARGVSLEIL